LILWAARRYAGPTLREIGEPQDGMDHNAVAMAICRFEVRAPQKPMQRLEATTCDVQALSLQQRLGAVPM